MASLLDIVPALTKPTAGTSPPPAKNTTIPTSQNASATAHGGSGNKIKSNSKSAGNVVTIGAPAASVSSVPWVVFLIFGLVLAFIAWMVWT